MICGRMGVVSRCLAMVGLIAFWLGTCTLLSAYSTRGAYEGWRQGGREACQNKAPESDRAACMARLEDSYDSYTRQRQEALEGAQNAAVARKACYEVPPGSDRDDCLKRLR